MHEGKVRDSKRRDAIAREIDAAMARELELRKTEKAERAIDLGLRSPISA